MDKVSYLNELGKRYIVLGEEKNKKGDSFFVCAIKDNDDDYTVIMLKDIEHRIHPPKINIITDRDIDNENKKVINIADILTSEENVGNGSILMKYLFKHIDENNDIVKIIGTISPVDKEHFDRLEHFYKNLRFAGNYSLFFYFLYLYIKPCNLNE